MTAFARTDGKRVTKTVSNLSTSAQDLITAAQQKPVTLESITFCNTTGTTERKVSFYVKDGATNYYIFRAKPLAGWQTQIIDTHSVVLRPGQTFSVVSDGAGVDVVAVFIESSSQQEQDGATMGLNAFRGASA